MNRGWREGFLIGPMGASLIGVIAHERALVILDGEKGGGGA